MSAVSRTLAEEIEAEKRRMAEIQADPFCDIQPPRLNRSLPESCYKAPLVTWTKNRGTAR